MNPFLDTDRPIFQQIAEQIEDDIINGMVQEGERIPSTNEFAAHYQINPATAAKGINQLVEKGILFKKRGIGMFVAEGAKGILTLKRKEQFYETFILPLKKEAAKLNISVNDLKEMLEKGSGHNEG
ncbi:GntR family transcriptional regulator [Metabacillus idriensis]|uniref:GntR family transcriptional regulator n=1 Tax=Metabacillus idriensis TaxID=324768 RepID=A0A6I2MHI2_9BACI|nr:GntR family transcriptional regulator [Metabacillus idriensis]MCM3598794.1 GntR family transcriptional regulator [Metabacillus idriensis]MRX56536.1 GntR family transcriptional regulator [Metabacillus idriensis]OHR73430.1 GntR family transcriptional regulator [Bacillus sp. HMSC76G11]